MELNEAISLIRHPLLLQDKASVWADLGCGSGLFTAALAHGLGAGSTVYAIDQDPVKLDLSNFPAGIDLKPLRLDFTRDELPVLPLDGILMANALHFVADKPALLARLSTHLKSESFFLLVEYDLEKAIPPWVPYPLPFNRIERLFAPIGFSKVLKLGEKASRYNRANLYGALLSKPG